jgi:hypothetical protein
MAELLTLRNALWLLTTSVEVLLLVCLLRRKLQRTHAALIIYIAGAIAESAIAVYAYWHWGFSSPTSSNVVWTSQAIVVCLRFAVVLETASRILSRYRGIWVLAKPLLWAAGIFAAGYSFFVADKQIAILVVSLDRGSELAIAAFVVALLVFARYYLLPLHPLDRALTIGLGLYSCFNVINVSLFERFRDSYLELWGYLDILTFLASLLIWLHAVRAYSPTRVAGPEPQTMPEGFYGQLSPEINLRLKHLNEQISQLFHARNPNP